MTTTSDKNGKVGRWSGLAVLHQLCQRPTFLCEGVTAGTDYSCSTLVIWRPTTMCGGNLRLWRIPNQCYPVKKPLQAWNQNEWLDYLKYGYRIMGRYWTKEQPFQCTALVWDQPPYHSKNDNWASHATLGGAGYAGLCMRVWPIPYHRRYFGVWCVHQPTIRMPTLL